MQMTATPIKKEALKRLIKQGPKDIVELVHQGGESLIEHFETDKKLRSRQQTLTACGRRTGKLVSTRSFVDKRRSRTPHALVIEAKR